MVNYYKPSKDINAVPTSSSSARGLESLSTAFQEFAGLVARPILKEAEKLSEKEEREGANRAYKEHLGMTSSALDVGVPVKDTPAFHKGYNEAKGITFAQEKLRELETEVGRLQQTDEWYENPEAVMGLLDGLKDRATAEALALPLDAQQKFMETYSRTDKDVRAKWEVGAEAHAIKKQTDSIQIRAGATVADIALEAKEQGLSFAEVWESRSDEIGNIALEAHTYSKKTGIPSSDVMIQAIMATDMTAEERVFALDNTMLGTGSLGDTEKGKIAKAKLIDEVDAEVDKRYYQEQLPALNILDRASQDPTTHSAWDPQNPLASIETIQTDLEAQLEEMLPGDEFVVERERYRSSILGNLARSRRGYAGIIQEQERKVAVGNGLLGMILPSQEEGGPTQGISQAQVRDISKFYESLEGDDKKAAKAVLDEAASRVLDNALSPDASDSDLQAVVNIAQTYERLGLNFNLGMITGELDDEGGEQVLTLFSRLEEAKALDYFLKNNQEALDAWELSKLVQHGRTAVGSYNDSIRRNKKAKEESEKQQTLERGGIDFTKKNPSEYESPQEWNAEVLGEDAMGLDKDMTEDARIFYETLYSDYLFDGKSKDEAKAMATKKTQDTFQYREEYGIQMIVDTRGPGGGISGQLLDAAGGDDSSVSKGISSAVNSYRHNMTESEMENLKEKAISDARKKWERTELPKIVERETRDSVNLNAQVNSEQWNARREDRDFSHNDFAKDIVDSAWDSAGWEEYAQQGDVDRSSKEGREQWEEIRTRAGQKKKAQARIADFLRGRGHKEWSPAIALGIARIIEEETGVKSDQALESIGSVQGIDFGLHSKREYYRREAKIRNEAKDRFDPESVISDDVVASVAGSIPNSEFEFDSDVSLRPLPGSEGEYYMRDANGNILMDVLTGEYATITDQMLLDFTEAHSNSESTHSLYGRYKEALDPEGVRTDARDDDEAMDMLVQDWAAGRERERREFNPVFRIAYQDFVDAFGPDAAEMYTSYKAGKKKADLKKRFPDPVRGIWN